MGEQAVRRGRRGTRIVLLALLLGLLVPTAHAVGEDASVEEPAEAGALVSEADLEALAAEGDPVVEAALELLRLLVALERGDPDAARGYQSVMLNLNVTQVPVAPEPDADASADPSTASPPDAPPVPAVEVQLTLGGIVNLQSQPNQETLADPTAPAQRDAAPEDVDAGDVVDAATAWTPPGSAPPLAPPAEPDADALLPGITLDARGEAAREDASDDAGEDETRPAAPDTRVDGGVASGDSAADADPATDDGGDAPGEAPEDDAGVPVTAAPGPGETVGVFATARGEPFALAGPAAVVGIGVAAAAAFAVALYALGAFSHRFTRDEVLRSGRRARLLETLQREPGLTVSQAARRTGMTWKACAHHLRVLERERFVTTREVSGRTLYVPTGAGMSRDGDVAALLARAPATFARVLAHVHENPGATPREVREATGLTSAHLSYYVKKFVHMGLVRRERDGARVRLFPEPAATGARGTARHGP